MHRMSPGSGNLGRACVHRRNPVLHEANMTAIMRVIGWLVLLASATLCGVIGATILLGG